RLRAPLQVAVLPNARAVTDVAVALRQRGLELVRSYMHEEQCIAQDWRLRWRIFGTAVIEVRFLQADPDGSLKTRFFCATKAPEAANAGAVVQLRSAKPFGVTDRRVPMAGPVSVVEPGDPFVADRTKPGPHEPADLAKFMSYPGMEKLDSYGYFHYGMPPEPSATVRRARSEQIDILKRLLNFCEERALQPLLADGSLLGAVRHKGYIPWDDDIDLWMLRSDFEKLVASELPEGLAILHYTTNDRFHLGF